MSTFSTIACYASLTFCSKSDVFHAYTRMVATLIQEKRYEYCEPEQLCSDFLAYFGFPIPYHPMQTILGECVNAGYLKQNGQTRQLIPNYDRIDKEDFVSIVKEKDREYHRILEKFREYLASNHNIHSSDDDLNEKILAFVERYGIKTKTDTSILRKVKNDYLFADFLVHCEETGERDVLDYLNDYTIGLSLSEIFTYCERPEAYTAKGTRVYMDTGILFRLLGVDSSDRSISYQDFLKNIRRTGMQVAVYEHTILEMIGIIEGAKRWIGNYNFDPSRASEAAYHFVTNNWTVEQVNELSCTLRTKLTEDYNIFIDKMPYPKKEDIHTPFEADIKEMIVEEYKGSHPSVSVEELDHSIDQDAKSIFFTQHKNGTAVPYHINDVKNIFITLNRSLARVGYDISYSLASSKEYFIPVVMTDIKWGTLIWFHSPATISTLNRPRLVSAAYAAFRPSQELTKKLNSSLIKLEEQGNITPELCYLLKVSPVAQRLLAKKTINNPDRFFDETPLEILQELQQRSYESGSQSRQKEIDDLKRKNEDATRELSIERHKNKIEKLLQESKSAGAKIADMEKKKQRTQCFLDEQRRIKEDIDLKASHFMTFLKALISLAALILLIFAVRSGSAHAWLLSLLQFCAAVVLLIVGLWNDKNVTLLSAIPGIENWYRRKQYAKNNYSEEEVVRATDELLELPNELLALRAEKREIDLEAAQLQTDLEALRSVHSF